MNAPLIWILVPLLTSTVLFAFRKQVQLCAYLAGFISLFLAVLALVLPIGQTINIGSFQFSLLSDLPVLGRKLVIASGDRPILFLLFIMGAYWFFTGSMFKIRNIIVPVELGLIGLLVAALAVEPFIYAALIIEIAVIVTILILIDPGQTSRKGILRFLIFQTMGMPFILLAGWFLASGEITPINEVQLTQSSLLLGLGFAFWLGIFPLYTWIPMIAEEVKSLVSGYVFSMLSLPVFLFLLNFLNNYAWLRDFTVIYSAFRWLGAIMIFTGGLWSLFQQNIQKLFGFLVLIANGLLFIALGIKGRMGMQILTATLIPRLLSFALMSLSLTIINKDFSKMSFESLAGLIWKKPFASVGILVSIFTVSGFPLLAGFPIVFHLAILLSDFSIISLILLTIGEVALFMTGLKFLFITVKRFKNMEFTTEKTIERLVIFILILLLLMIGIVPSFFFISISNILAKFTFLFE